MHNGPFQAMLNSFAFLAIVVPLVAGLVTKVLWSLFEGDKRTGTRIGLIFVDIALLVLAFNAWAMWWRDVDWYGALILALVFFGLGFGIIELIVGTAKGAASAASAARNALIGLFLLVLFSAVLFGNFSFSPAAQNGAINLIGLFLLAWVLWVVGSGMTKSFKKGGGHAHGK